MRVAIIHRQFDNISEGVFINKKLAIAYLRAKGMKCYGKNFWAESEEDVEQTNCYTIEMRVVQE